MVSLNGNGSVQFRDCGKPWLRRGKDLRRLIAQTAVSPLLRVFGAKPDRQVSLSRNRLEECVGSYESVIKK